jgi:hypothetical protein
MSAVTIHILFIMAIMEITWFWLADKLFFREIDDIHIVIAQDT